MSEKPLIMPTVGRVVWVRGRTGSQRPEPCANLSGTQPEVALITYVHAADRINVAGWNAIGVPFALEHIFLAADEEAEPVGGQYAHWMPYQKGQAAKTEQLEKAIRLGPASAVPGA